MALVLAVVAGLLVSCATAPSTQGEKEALLAEAASTMKQMTAEDPTPGTLVQRGYGCALFPKVTKGGLVAGGAYGRGAVYAQGQHMGYDDLSQGSVGLQAGAQTPTNHRSQTAIWSSTPSTTFDPVGPAA